MNQARKGKVSSFNELINELENNAPEAAAPTSDSSLTTGADPAEQATSDRSSQDVVTQLTACFSEMNKVDAELVQLQQQVKAVEKRQEELRARVEDLAAGTTGATVSLEDTSSRKKTLADLGYHFKDGKLRTIDGDNGFTFTNQKEYEELGGVIDDVVYEMLEEAGLERRYAKMGRDRRFYFASPGYGQKDRVLVLIHGSGVVKAGQWARRLIINESLERGTQLDYIKRGLSNDWGVVVLNYNEKCEGEEKRGCHSSDAHGLSEWKHALDAAKYSDIVVVAHSAGGDIVSDAVHRMLRVRDFRVQCVALTDSWFSEGKHVLAVNWNTQKKRLHRNGSNVYQMYSGDETHEGTSAACIDSVFALLEKVNDTTSMDDFHCLIGESEMIILEKYTKEKDQEENEAKRLGLDENKSVKEKVEDGKQREQASDDVKDEGTSI